MAQIAVFASRHRGGLEECRLWALGSICPVVAIVDGPLSAVCHNQPTRRKFQRSTRTATTMMRIASG